MEQKKYRVSSSCFLAEGNKLVSDLLPFFDCELLLAESSWLAQQGDVRVANLEIVDNQDIRKASLLKNPQEVIAVFRQAQHVLSPEGLMNSLSLVLDGLQDPGNLGTIIRLADWFGIADIICSESTVDVYNPKVVQASMGALARVRVHYVDLLDFLPQFKTIVPIYGTFLEGGTDIYASQLAAKGMIVMGNEGNGISEEVAAYIDHRLYIPTFPQGASSSESLNVAMATAITCAEFRRQEVYATQGV